MSSRFRTSFKEGVTASVHVTRTTLGNGVVQHDIEDLLNFIHVKRKLVQPATIIGQFHVKQQLGNGVVHDEHDILYLPNRKNLKMKLVIKSSTIDLFVKKQRIHLDKETKRDNNTTIDVKFIHSPIVNKHNKGLDDLVDQEEVGGYECDAEEKINIVCNPKGMS